VQAEKMASLGELTAGIAHEINNPINFVYAGVDGLKFSLEGLIEVLNKYGELDDFEQVHQAQELLADIRLLKDELYFEETKKGVFEVVEAIKEGAMRTSEIVDGLRNFSRLDEWDLKLANIHVGIENTLVLLSPKIKDGQIKLIKYYDDLIPEVNCYPGQLNQVFMNLLSNAIEAIPDQGTIVIRTINYDDFVTISIKDDGRGIPIEIKSKIFEPFFTTKGLGKGTGLGLSISFGIIQKHYGKIEVHSSPNNGAEFTITLPKDLV
jgi:signal transduction histidine kinase